MSPRAGLDPAAVVGTAAALADQEGLESVTLTRLAAALAVRPPSLYNHVAGLPGLRRALALQGLRELTARLSRAAVGRSGDAAVLAMADAYRGFVHERPGLYAATLRSPRLSDPADTELRAAEQELLDLVLAALSAYALRGDAAIHAARGLRSVIHGFATLEAAEGFGIAVDVDESFRQLLQIYVAGLNKAAGARAHPHRNS
jgi:AcrR family transcriptional regulator